MPTMTRRAALAFVASIPAARRPAPRRLSDPIARAAVELADAAGHFERCFRELASLDAVPAAARRYRDAAWAPAFAALRACERRLLNAMRAGGTPAVVAGGRLFVDTAAAAVHDGFGAGLSDVAILPASHVFEG